MTEFRFLEERPPVWADSAMQVWSGDRHLVSVFLKRLNYTADRYYIGMQLHTKPRRKELAAMQRAFIEHSQGAELEALIDEQDTTARRFASFFGFVPGNYLPLGGHLVYERVS